MRLSKLNLTAIGPFTATDLDLSSNTANLHIVYGGNEAGKSSALRALLALLFGFEHQTGDNFQHSNPNLAVGATVTHSNGEQLVLWRRKGTKNTLLDANRNPITGAVWQRFLGAVDKNFFASMFGLDHVRLRQGGQEILEGGGQVGQALFTAGTGITGLKQIATKLRQEADSLFKPHGSKQRISILNRQYKELRHERDSQALRGKDWQAQEAALEQAKTKLLALNAQLQSLKAEQSRLERLRQALPHIAKRDELQTSLASVKNAVVLPEDFVARRIRTMEQLHSAKYDIAIREQQLNLLNSELQGLSINENLLPAAAEIERLAQQSGQFTKAKRDAIGLEIRVAEQLQTAEDLLQEVRPDLTLEQASSTLRISGAQQEGIRELGNRYGAIEARLKNAQTQLGISSNKYHNYRQQLQQLPKVLDVTELRHACELVQRSGNIEENLQVLQAQLVHDRSQAAIGLRRLWGWTGDLVTLEQLALPAAETVEAFRNTFEVLQNQKHLLSSQRDEAKNRLSEAEQQLQALQLAGQIPDEAALIAARSHRDYGWQLVYKAWISGQRDLVAEQEFNHNLPLPEAYVQSVLAADVITDRLRREATRVEQQARAIADSNRYQNLYQELQRELTLLAQRHAEQTQAWQALWQPLHIDCRTPKEMRSWLDQADKLRQQTSQLRASEQKIAIITAQRDYLMAELTGSLTKLMLDGALGTSTADSGAAPDPHTHLAASLARSLALIQQHEGLRLRQQQLSTTVADLERQVQDWQQAVVTAQDELTAWRQQWTAAIAVLGLDTEASPIQANTALDRVAKILAALKDVKDKRERIKGIERDGLDFTTVVRTLCAKVAPDLCEASPVDAIITLNTRLQDVRSQLSRRQALSQQQLAYRQQLTADQKRYEQASQQLATCLREANCTEAERLPEVEAMAAKRHDIERELDNCRNHLLDLSAGKGEAVLLVEAATIDADALPARLEAMQTDIQRLDNERSEIEQVIGGKLAHLQERQAGSSAAAECNEKLEQVLAAIRSAGERYLQLRFASAVLDQQIEDYRQKSQTPLLNMASDIFARLTAKAFTRLEVTFDDGEREDKKLLQGIRPTGEAVTVSGMSDGTRDQLFLALRLAGIRTYMEKNEPLPLVMDDILIHYDDTRSVATLRELAHFSKQTQVLMFTHHQHLIQLAQKTLPPEQFCLHTLTGRF